MLSSVGYVSGYPLCFSKRGLVTVEVLDEVSMRNVRDLYFAINCGQYKKGTRVKSHLPHMFEEYIRQRGRNTREETPSDWCVTPLVCNTGASPDRGYWDSKTGNTAVTCGMTMTCSGRYDCWQDYDW